MKTLLLLNTMLGGIVIADLVKVTDVRFLWLFVLQGLLYLINIGFLFVKTESRKLKVTIVLLRYLGLSSILIDLMLKFSYSRNIVVVVLSIIMFFVIMTLALYFERDNLDEKLAKYSGQYYNIINILSSSFALGVLVTTYALSRMIRF